MKNVLLEHIMNLYLPPKFQLKTYFLIDENVEEFYRDRPFVDLRMRISDYFLSDIEIGIQKLSSFIKSNNIKFLSELIQKKSVFAFNCDKSTKYESNRNKTECPQIICRFLFDKKDVLAGYFGDTQKINSNGKDFILVTIHEANFIDQLGMIPEFTPIDNYLRSLISRLKPSYVYRSNFVHEFQHVMQIIHNFCSEDKYDLDGDLDKIQNDNFETYYSVTTEREAFYIQIMKFLVENNLLTSDYDSLKENFLNSMNLMQIDRKFFKIFESALKSYVMSFKENKINEILKDILIRSGSKNPDKALQRSIELSKLNSCEFNRIFLNFMKNGVSVSR